MISRLCACLTAIFFSHACNSAGGEVRPIDVVAADADVILEGVVIGSGVGKCGGEEDIGSFYYVRATKIVKGELEPSDIKACGIAPMLLDSKYVIFGKAYKADEIIFESDSVFLEFPLLKYYRLIVFDSPVVNSDRGRAYATGILDSDFQRLYSELTIISR